MDALELETKSKRAIVSERTTVEFEDEVRALLSERAAQSCENAWDRLCGIVPETTSIAAARAQDGVEERKIPLEHRVYDELIVMEPIPAKKRANRQTAMVTLRTAQNAPKHRALGERRSPSAGASSDERT